ncbi:anti-sigma factor [Mycobacterium sp. CBMA 234]|uniref:anti-sigma factor family protein n=1 Tax=Mycolicibacterium sp. CBMA 234 TaxID=1918495 RepID=UPI0012DE1EF9|nr:zf-HC2 domain-containing protein [Mycolicibacterium sp. CBMA 234]MUL64037.1 anti-sigma factor [Mycolicibacterium sp. CBMA 234]
MSMHLVESVGPFDGDRYATWDAAYVLGSLSSSERREYEAHLQTCARCRNTVAEISGVPALLGLLDLESVQGLGAEEPEPPLPPEMLDSVLAKVRWRRRRTRWVTTAVAGLAAAVLAVGAVAVVRPEFFGPTQTQEQAEQLPMQQVAPTPFNATIALSSYSWGTRIDMACSYGDWSSGPAAPPSNLGMVVVGRDGSHTQIATWFGMSRATALPSGNTPMPVSEIAAVQLVSADNGKVLLERNL